ncbi:MAG: FISUMP domain-containing protein [Bacteroidota bacterium]
MMKINLLLLCLVISVSTTFAQLGINANGSMADPSAMLDVKSADKGILIPRLTTGARNLIPSPATGLLVYNTTTNSFNFFNGSTWSQVTSTFISASTGTTSAGGGVSISANPGTQPNGAAMLDISSSSRGILLPRTTPALIASPATGLLIFNTSTNLLNYYTGTGWLGLCAVSTGQPGAAGNQGALGIAINNNGSGPDPSSLVDVNASGKGMLIPRITEVVRNGILPTAGLAIYNTTSNALEFYNGTGWYRLTTNASVSVSILATYNPIEAGSLTIFNATAINGGSDPVYQWKVNNIATGENSSYIMLWPSNGDVVTCSLTSNQSCVSNNPAVSNAVVMVVITPCPGTPTVTYGGKVYKTVQIGPQCWFRENLNIGTKIPYNSEQTNNSVMEKYCYNDDEANCDVYGGFYQWAELVQYYNGATNTTSWSPLPEGYVQGLCPLGWHVPSSTDWATLVTSLGGSTGVACKIKEFGPTHWRAPNDCASNISGFTSLGAGARYSIGMFYGLTLYTEYWTCTEFSANEAWDRYMDVDRGTLWNNMNSKRDGYSARCMKDICNNTTIPVLTTSPVTGITVYSAVAGGNIVPGCGITARGVCWSTNANPTINNYLTSDGGGSGSFISNITGLVSNKLYHVRAYATNDIGTAYGNEVTFTTYPVSALPTVTTTAATNITLTSVTSGGNVTANGGYAVTARGVCYSMAPLPTTTNGHTTDGSGNGSFISSITELTPNTHYYLRAYASNSMGTSYGDEVSFTTISDALYIGQSYGGGIIFYLDATGLHGLISAQADQSLGAEWGCTGTSIPGTSTDIGTGQANTTAIVNNCSMAGIAARICDDLILNEYMDWFLPSMDELNQMYLQKAVIGGFSNDYYWTSTECYENFSWIQGFSDGYQGLTYTATARSVRAIRAF